MVLCKNLFRNIIVSTRARVSTDAFLGKKDISCIQQFEIIFKKNVMNVLYNMVLFQYFEQCPHYLAVVHQNVTLKNLS